MISHHHRRVPLLAAAALVLLAACSQSPKAAKGVITGLVHDASSSSGVGGAVVRLSDGRSVTANESGWFFFADVDPAARDVLIATHDGFVEGVEPVTVRAGAMAYVDLTLLPVAATTTFDVAAGGNVTDGAGASATFPAGALVGSDGHAITGSVTVDIAPLDPSDRTRIAAFPGDFSATRTDGSATLLETVVPMAITARQGDARLQIVSGMHADVTFPIPAASAATAPATIELWSLDPATGAWREEGTATRMDDPTSPGGAVYHASIPHLSWWNCDRPITETTCIRGCVRSPDETPVADVHVNAAGVDYQGESDTTTGEDGCFAVNVKLGANVAVVATTTGLVSDPANVMTSTTPMRAENGASACQDVGLLHLAQPLAQIVLQWGMTPSDLDSHFTGPDATESTGRFHVYYSQKGSLAGAPFCALDTDDTSSFGPEITTLVRAPAGKYRFSVHNYSGQSAGPIESSMANVILLLPRQGLVQRFDVPVTNAASDNVWRVFDLQTGGGGQFDVTTLGTFAPDSAGYDP